MIFWELALYGPFRRITGFAVGSDLRQCERARIAFAREAARWVAPLVGLATSPLKKTVANDRSGMAAIEPCSCPR